SAISTISRSRARCAASRWACNSRACRSRRPACKPRSTTSRIPKRRRPASRKSGSPERAMIVRALWKMPHRRFLLLLTVLLGIEFVVCAINPNDRKDWMLENVLVVLFVAAAYASYRKLTLSRISYLLIFVFLSLHLVGAHYT